MKNQWRKSGFGLANHKFTGLVAEAVKKEYGYIDDELQRDAFAFNYWVLSRLYSLDEEVIPSYVTDIQDKGVDCFVHYEDTKELFWFKINTMMKIQMLIEMMWQIFLNRH